MNSTDDAVVHQVDVGGRRLAVQIAGRGPVVLLETGAGSGGIGPAWNGVDRLIAEFARVIVYDRAGTGDSEPAQPCPTSLDRVRDLAALLDLACGSERIVLVGWSLGGLIAQHFALLHPERVAGLLLIDPAPTDTFSAAPAWQRLLMRSSLPGRLFTAIARRGWLKGPRAQAGLRRMLQAQLGPHFEQDKLPLLLAAASDARLHELTLMESAGLERSCAAVLELLAQRGLPPVPLIVLSAGYHGRGVSPRLLRRVSESHARLVASVPGAELRVLPGVSHYVPFETPQAIVQAVRDLIGRAAAR